MLKVLFPIAFIMMLVLGVLMIGSPNLLIRADKRDDPQAVAMTKKAGIAFIGFSLFAALKILKYSLR